MHTTVQFNGAVMTFPWRGLRRVPAALKRDVNAPWEQAVEISRKGRIKEQTEERVDAAVGGGDELRDLDACIQVVAALFPLQGQVFLESRQEKHSIVRCPHQKEHARYDKSKLAEILLPLPEALSFPHLPAAEY